MIREGDEILLKVRVVKVVSSVDGATGYDARTHFCVVAPWLGSAWINGDDLPQSAVASAFVVPRRAFAIGDRVRAVWAEDDEVESDAGEIVAIDEGLAWVRFSDYHAVYATDELRPAP